MAFLTLTKVILTPQVISSDNSGEFVAASNFIKKLVEFIYSEDT